MRRSPIQHHRTSLPQITGGTFLTWTGIGTDLVFNHGVGVPGDPVHPLLATAEGRQTLRDLFLTQIDAARQAGVATILEAPIWNAHRDRGAAAGFDVELLARRNREAMALMASLRDDAPDLTVVISACIGPRGDAFAPESIMTVDEARTYHAEQLGWLAETKADMATLYTACHADEAAGFILAASDVGLPAVVSFTVETNGLLPTGATLADTIQSADAQSDKKAAYFMINCAHPDHFGPVLERAPWMERIRGFVANASRHSHDDLNESSALDAGDPVELGQQLSDLRADWPHVMVLGGCCGTDGRHLAQIASKAIA